MSSEDESRVSAGVLPKRTSHLVEAAEVLTSDGAVVVTGLATEPENAVGLASALFSGRTLAVPEAAEVRAGGVRDASVAVNRPGPDDPLQMHTDGFAYGDHYPDYLLLLCANSSDEGGESILVDGYALLDQLAAAPGGAALVEDLETVAINQTEDGMRHSVSPVVITTPSGRRALRRFLFQRPADDSADPEGDARLIERWRQACDAAAETAPRFKLGPGEAYVADNYRMLHGRESYTDHDRLMWRVWVWTDASNGLPAGLLHSDTRYAAALSE
jgi:alpha-ketoglutarate-dependent taurine dioxygenase